MKGTQMRIFRRLLMIISVVALVTMPTLIGTASAEVSSDVAAKLLRIAKCESGLRPDAVSPSGKYHGLFQFDQRTWNATAKRAKRTDLVGVKPSQAHELNQIFLAIELFGQRGTQPWPVCGKR
jgi:hypothetical protein